MIHARKDYNRIQDPEGLIGKDEPVFLFRAKDKHFVEVLKHYAELNMADPEADRRLIQQTFEQMGRAIAWQEEHGTKTPDV